MPPNPRAGDLGETSLLDGSRVAKSDLRVNAYGEVDELNSMLGWCRVVVGSGVIGSRIEEVQRDLFALGAELARPPQAKQKVTVHLVPVEAEATKRLEQWMEEARASLPALHRFILPGGSEPSARLHLARTCCRRAERAVVDLHRQCGVRVEILMYLNRLSNLLFAWARQANRECGIPDVPWRTEP